MSKVISATWNMSLRKGQWPWKDFTPTRQMRILGINVTPVLVPCIISPRISDLIRNYSAITPSSTAIRVLGVQQIREMSWGNVNKPNKRFNRRPNKHKDMRWARLRKWKVLKIELPDREFDRRVGEGKVSPEEIRAEMKLKGILPPSKYMEAPVFMAATGALFDEFKPSEGDAYSDFMSGESEKSEESGWSLSKTFRSSIEKAKSKTFRATRKIRTFDDNFDASTFGSQEAKEIYINAHKALASKQEKRLHQFATEKAYPEMMHNTKGRSIYWDFIQSLEPLQVVQVRSQDVITKGNVFAQVTVRFHTQQILAIYDRFGRLIHGNPYVAKDVLEYVVFEKHLADTYGKWRLHHKITPVTTANERRGGIITHVIKDSDVGKSSEEESSTTNDEVDVDEKIQNEKKYGVSYKTDEEQVSIFNKFGKMVRRDK